MRPIQLDYINQKAEKELPRQPNDLPHRPGSPSHSTVLKFA